MLLRILIAGKPDRERQRLERAVRRLDVLVHTVDDAQGLHDQLGRRPFDLALLHIESLERSALGLIRQVSKSGGRIGVLAIVDHEDPSVRSEYIAGGCLAVINRQVDEHLMLDAISTIAERHRAESALNRDHVPTKNYGLGDYSATSLSMREFLSQARRIAHRDTTVLLLGETGVGKGLLARSLHNEGPRADGPFIAVNCGVLSPSLIESELFGHEKGSFTGASRDRRGHFELAHGGTLFLDEIGELPKDLQVKLLRALEDNSIQPLGSEKRVPVDVRIMAASNRDLTREVAEKRFRTDLYYRLNVVTLTLPPLRDRKEDIPELAESYLKHFSDRLHGDAEGLSAPALEALLRYDWPGNVRELINAMERAVLMCTGSELDVDDLPSDITGLMPEETNATVASPTGFDDAWLGRTWRDVREQVLENTERRYLLGILECVHGRISEAAARAGIGPRALHEKMRRHGLRKDDFKEQSDARTASPE